MAELQRKRCLYEVIGVSRDASPEEIRSSYRRLALQLHPDKIAAASGGVASPAATAAFQELLHAYEVLSDPKERSYYDSHRSQILFSDPSSTSSSKHNKSSFFDVDLYSFFSNSSFSGFSDTGRGFYKVYGDLFAKIYNQEIYFAKELALGVDAISPAPLIGNLDSPYTQVTAFYNYWLGFCTVMDFGWVDEYDASMGPNRRSRRVMEEENKKIRKKARREYNESVRGLAAFVKKRDKRVVDMLVKKKAEEEKRREKEKAKKREEEMRRMERAKVYEEPEWARVDDEFDIDDGSEDDEEKKGKGGEEFYCVVCSKKFKSDKQWKNHEQSKKHKDKVADLRMSFKEEENGSVDDEEEEVRVGFDYEPPEKEDSFSDAVDELCDDVKDDLQLPGEKVDGDSMEGSDHDEASVLEAMLSGRKNRKGGFMGHDVPTSNEDDHPGNVEDDSMEYNNSRKNRKNRASRRGTSGKTGPEDVNDNSNGPNQNGTEVSEVSNQERTATNIEKGPSFSSVEESEVTKINKRDKHLAKKQIRKKQQVDSKGAGKREADDDFKTSSKGRKQKGISSKAPVNACGTCDESFESRNKLFAHLGDTGHAMLKSR